MGDKMIYKKFYFENYKGVKDRLEFEIDANSNKPYCIIGKNEGGKTTILKGINLIGQLITGSGKIKEQEIIKIKPKIDFFSENITLGAQIVFDKNDFPNEKTLSLFEGENNIDIKFTFNFQKNKYEKIDIETKLNGEKLANNLNNHIFKLLKDNAQEIVYYDDFMLELPDFIRYKKNKKKTEDKKFLSDLNQSWQNIFDDIIKATYQRDDISFQESVVDWNEKEQGITSIIPQMEAYLTNILKDWKDNSGSHISGFKIDRHDTEDFADFSIQLLSKNNKRFAISERSKGLQWSFCFNVLTEIKKHRRPNGFIFLLDEPANNLHMHIQRKMLKQELNTICSNKNILIYSTHASFLIDRNNIKNIFVVKNKAGEFEDTNIILSSYNNDKLDESITTTDIEPLIISSIDNDILNIDVDDKKEPVWHKIKDWFKEKVDVEKLTTIASNLANVIDKLPKTNQ